MVQMDSPYKLPIASTEKPRGLASRLLAGVLNASLGLALPVALLLLWNLACKHGQAVFIPMDSGLNRTLVESREMGIRS